MIRKRLAFLAAMAGFGLSLGCANMKTACGTGGGGLLNRLCGRCRTTTVTEAIPITETGVFSVPGSNSCGGSCCEGPMLMDRGAVGEPPGIILNGYGQPPPAWPMITPPPGSVPGGPVMPPAQGRLTPTPQAQPMPFTP